MLLLCCGPLLPPLSALCPFRRVAAKEREQVELRELYLKESRARKALHNELVELKWVSALPPPPPPTHTDAHSGCSPFAAATDPPPLASPSTPAYTSHSYPHTWVQCVCVCGLPIEQQHTNMHASRAP